MFKKKNKINDVFVKLTDSKIIKTTSNYVVKDCVNKKQKLVLMALQPNQYVPCTVLKGKTILEFVRTDKQTNKTFTVYKELPEEDMVINGVYYKRSNSGVLYATQTTKVYKC